MATATLDREKHEYRINGTVVPSVTQCLKLISSLAMVSESVLRKKADFGTKVHRAIELFESGRLKRDALHPELDKRLEQWIRAKEFFKLTTEHSEKIVYSTSLGCAGALDFAGKLDDGAPVVVDFKTCPYYREQEIQTAAYKMMAVEMGLVEKNAKRATIHLLEDEFEIRWHKKATDELVFRSLLNVTRWQREIK